MFTASAEVEATSDYVSDLFTDESDDEDTSPPIPVADPVVEVTDGEVEITKFHWAAFHAIYDIIDTVLRNPFDVAQDAGVLKHICEYMQPGDLANFAKAHIHSADVVRRVHHDGPRGDKIWKQRFDKCVEIMGRMDNFEGEGSIPIGKHVTVVHDDGCCNLHSQDADLENYNGEVVHCRKEGPLVIVYALLYYYAYYGPIVVVKGTTDSIVPTEPNLMRENDITWELPPRNDKELEEQSQRHEKCEEKNCRLCGKTPRSAKDLDEWKRRREAILERTTCGYNYYDQLRTYSDIRVIDIIDSEDHDILFDNQEEGWRDAMDDGSWEDPRQYTLFRDDPMEVEEVEEDAASL